MKKGLEDDIVAQPQEEFKPQVYTNTRENRGSFMAQLNALLYKNTVIQMRQRKTNILQIGLVVIIVGLACWLCGLTPGPNEDTYTNQQYAYIQWDGEYDYNCNYPGSSTCTGYFPSAFYDMSGQAGELTNITGGPKSGLLGNIQQYPAVFTKCTSYDSCVSNYTLSPFFEPFDSATALDNYIIQQIKIYEEDNNCCTATPTVPTAGITFKSIDYTNVTLSYDIQLQDSDNYNIYYPVNYNAIGQDTNYPSFYLQIISNALLKTSFPNINATMMATINTLAGNSTYSYYSANPLISFCIIPPAFCFLLPVFVFAIVLDRSNKTLELNKLMRLRMSAYWISYLIIDIIFYCIPLVLVAFLGVAFRQWFITKSFGPTMVLFVLWGFAQISLGFFMSTLFTKERVATVFSYVFILITLAAGMVLNLLVFTTNRAPGWYMWLPPFTFLRGFYLIQSSFINLPAIQFSNMGIDNEMWTVYILLIAQSIVLFFLAFYLEQVIPRSWGISRSPLFPIKDTIAWIKSKSAKKGESTRIMPIVEEQINCTSNEIDIRQEADNAMNGRENFVLKCVGLTKQYEKKGKTALDNFFLALPERECFGLLGPNGAGKTTLISILSGTIPASSGYAVVDGETTKGDNQTSRNVIGICPQFDILWDDLTVVEHLRYYFKMKGIPRGQKLHVLVSNLTDHVGLQDHLNKRARDLSGGMKRKLSIAISLCGNPKLLLLDEPTTGLDPEARRDIWDIIQDAREGRSTIITTHNMEEADVLCTRIGIMANGTMKCIGNQQHLKSKYGAGYSLTITARTFAHLAEIQRWVKSLYPHATLDSNYGTNLNYLIAAEQMNISDLFNRMRLYKDTYGIQEWGINQTSLEEVFLKIVRATEGGEACQEV